MKLVDTSVAVDHLRGHSQAVALLEGILGSGEELIASELTRYELLAGARDEEQRALGQFFDALNWIGVDRRISATAGDLARQYRRRHPGIDDIDYLIAATTMVHRADLLTTNVRHFPMLHRLRSPY